MLSLKKLLKFTLSDYIHVIDFDHDQDTDQEFYQDLKLLISLVLLQLAYKLHKIKKI